VARYDDNDAHDGGISGDGETDLGNRNAGSDNYDDSDGNKTPPYMMHRKITYTMSTWLVSCA